jgi:phage-related protein
LELFKLLGTIAVNNAEANKALDETSGKGEKAQSKLSKTFGALGKGAAVAGKAIATGLAAGATAMAGLTAKALSAAGDLEQNMGGAEAVFGELGKTIGDMKTPMQMFNAETGKVETQMQSLETVSKEAYKNMGLSQSDYLATANKMGALFKGAGFETQEALNLSSQAMQRAADVASIMGIDTEAAMEAVANAAKGNFTMMDNLGVAMNDTAIAAYAQSKGINKATSEMSQQEKIGLAMEMFLEKTSYAAGNYAKENETLAGSLGTAKAAFQNFLAGSGDVDSLVSSFSNLANVVVRSLEEIAPRLTSGIADLVAKVAPLIAPLLNTLLPVLVEGAVSLVNGLVAALPGIITAILDIIPALIDGILQIADALVGALPQIIQAIVSALPTLIPALIDGVVSLIMMLVEMLPQIIDPLIAALPTIIISIVDALVGNLPVLIQGLISLIMGIVGALPQIIQALVDALPTVVSLLVQAILNNLPAIITGLIQVVVGIVAALPQILGSLIEAIPAALSGIWDGIANVFGGLGDWFGEKFSAAKDAAVNAWNDAKEKWNNIKEKCVEGFNNFKDKVSTKFNEAKEAAQKKWSDAKAKWNGIKEKCVEGFNDLKEKVSTKFSEAKEAAQQKWSDAKTKWSGIKDKVVDGFSDLKTKISTKFSEAKTAAEQKWSDAKSKFSSVKDKVVSAFSDLGSKLSPLFSKAKNNATQTWNDVKSIFNKFKNGDIVGAFSDLGSLLKSKFSSALNIAKKGFDKIKSIGSDLVTGLWNGINDKFSWLTGKIKSFASNVTDKLKGFFGIKSPSRVMRDEVGKQLAEGVAVGITSNSEKAESAAEKMGKNILDAAQIKLDNYKVYNDLTLADEVAFWDSVRQQVEEGTDARISADKKYFEAKKSLDAEILTAEETLQSSLDEIHQKNIDRLDEINQKTIDRKNSIMDSFDLFKDFGIYEKISADDMSHAFTTNIDALKNYDAVMESLRNKLSGTKFLDYLEGMGVESIGTLLSVDELSDMKLLRLATKYEQFENLAHDMAKEQVAKEQVVEETTSASLDAFQTYIGTLDKIGVDVAASADSIFAKPLEHAEDLPEAFKRAVDTFIEYTDMMLPEVEESAESIAEPFVEAAEKIEEAVEKPIRFKGGIDNEYTRILRYGASWESGHKMVQVSDPTDEVTRYEWVKTEPDSYDDDVNWHAKAMDNAMILEKPTIFGYDAATGKYLGGGEAGSEVVAGSQTLMNMIQNAVASQNSELVAILSKILNAILGMDANMGSHMRDALEGLGFEINRREFGRLVKAVN